MAEIGARRRAGATNNQDPRNYIPQTGESMPGEKMSFCYSEAICPHSAPTLAKRGHFVRGEEALRKLPLSSVDLPLSEQSPHVQPGLK